MYAAGASDVETVRAADFGSAHGFGLDRDGATRGSGAIDEEGRARRIETVRERDRVAGCCDGELFLQRRDGIDFHLLRAEFGGSQCHRQLQRTGARQEAEKDFTRKDLT